MFIGDQLVINGPSYQVIQPNGQPFLLGRLLRKCKTFSTQTGIYSDIFEFENMPSFSEFPTGIHNCRHIEVFSIASQKEASICCCWTPERTNEYTGPIYTQR